MSSGFRPVGSVRYFVAALVLIGLVPIGDALLAGNPSSALRWTGHGVIFLGYLGAALVALKGVLVIRRLRRETRFEQGHCRGCGYNLRGNTSGICPECGQATDAS
jgi:hypothetical protein